MLSPKCTYALIIEENICTGMLNVVGTLAVCENKSPSWDDKCLSIFMHAVAMSLQVLPFQKIVLI